MVAKVLERVVLARVEAEIHLIKSEIHVSGNSLEYSHGNKK